jgi:hypothetical protein
MGALHPNPAFFCASYTLTMSVRLDAFIRSLPKAPHVDVTQIRGNVSDAEKQLNANVFAYFFTGSGIAPIKHPFGYGIGGRLRIVALNVFDDLENGRAEGEVIYEIEVTKGAYAD